MKNFLAYILQPGNLLALLFLIGFGLTGAFYWHEGGKWIMLAGFIIVALFLYKSWTRGPKKKL